jgi:hypothetical protein
VIGAAAIGAVVTVAVLATRGGGSAAATTPTAAPSAAAEPGPRTHSVAVDSTPQGAHVREGDRELGTTPMTLEIDPGAPPRRLSLVLEGYSAHTFIPTREDTRITVPLAVAAIPAASTEKTAAPDKGPKPVTRVVVVPAPPPPTPPPHPPPSDINTAR